MSNALQEKLDELNAEGGVVGVAAAVLLDGQATYAFSGVTSASNPLEVDEATLFQFGSTGKTLTATAIMVLVEQGRVDLHAPVRTYLPGLTTKVAEVAEKVTVLQLLNHTAGWDGDLFTDTGRGDDALARYVDLVADLEQISPLGTTVTYNNAALGVAGRVVEKVTGTTYEQAVTDLVLTPLGLEDTLTFAEDVMLRRFAAGHERGEDGSVTLARPWPVPRGNTPAGGWSATAADQVAWARFHLGDGTAPDGTRVLSQENLEAMQTATVQMPGSALGDAVGISWLLRDVGGVREVAHGGTTHGQHSHFSMVPERGFALVVMTNTAPDGPKLMADLSRWAYEHHLGVVDAPPAPIESSEEELAQYAGTYETIASLVEVSVDGGRLALAARSKSGLGESDQDAVQRLVVARTAGPGDPFVIPEGPGEGMRGYMVRDEGGEVSGMHFGGRLYARVATSQG